MFRMMNCRVVDGRSMWAEGKIVDLRFIGLTLPECIYVRRARIQIAPFVDSVKLCFGCDEKVHIRKNCKKKPRCLHCERDQGLEAGHKCDSQTECINCGGKHATLDQECPTYKKLEAINRMMAHDNVPHVLARRILEENSSRLEFPGRAQPNFPPLSSGTGDSTGKTQSVRFDQKVQKSYSNCRSWSQAISSGDGCGSRRKHQLLLDLNSSEMSSVAEGVADEMQRNLMVLTEVLASAPDVALLIERIWKTIKLHLKVKQG